MLWSIRFCPPVNRNTPTAGLSFRPARARRTAFDTAARCLANDPCNSCSMRNNLSRSSSTFWMWGSCPARQFDWAHGFFTILPSACSACSNCFSSWDHPIGQFTGFPQIPIAFGNIHHGRDPTVLLDHGPRPVYHVPPAIGRLVCGTILQICQRFNVANRGLVIFQFQPQPRSVLQDFAVKGIQFFGFAVFHPQGMRPRRPNQWLCRAGNGRI